MYQEKHIKRVIMSSTETALEMYAKSTQAHACCDAASFRYTLQCLLHYILSELKSQQVRTCICMDFSYATHIAPVSNSALATVAQSLMTRTHSDWKFCALQEKQTVSYEQ